MESSTNGESGVGNRESGLEPNSERVRLLPSPPAPLPQGERGELSVKRAEAPVVGQASHARIAANRRNAAQSTGPRTLGGKRRVALNAVKHGRYASTDAWTAKTMLKLGEDPEAWRRRRQELLSDWQPRGVAETMLVEDLANLYWEKAWLRRAKAAHQWQKAESKALEREREALRAESEPFDLEQAASSGPADDTLLAPLSYWWAEVERQEAALDRQIERKIRLLVELQRRRREPERGRKERANRHRAAAKAGGTPALPGVSTSTRAAGRARLAHEPAAAGGRKKGAKRGKI